LSCTRLPQVPGAHPTHHAPPPPLLLQASAISPVAPRPRPLHSHPMDATTHATAERFCRRVARFVHPTLLRELLFTAQALHPSDPAWDAFGAALEGARRAPCASGLRRHASRPLNARTPWHDRRSQAVPHPASKFLPRCQGWTPVSGETGDARLAQARNSRHAASRRRPRRTLTGALTLAPCIRTRDRCDLPQEWLDLPASEGNPCGSCEAGTERSNPSASSSSACAMSL
jgi:hypothetical protein